MCVHITHNAYDIIIIIIKCMRWDRGLRSSSPSTNQLRYDRRRRGTRQRRKDVYFPCERNFDENVLLVFCHIVKINYVTIRKPVRRQPTNGRPVALHQITPPRKLSFSLLLHCSHTRIYRLYIRKK